MQFVEQLENRRLLASFTAASVAELISDMNAANAVGGSNTITLAPATTFKLTAANNNTDGPTGLPAVAAGNDLSIVGDANTIARSTTGGTPAFRLFAVASGGSLVLNNLTLSGGLASSASANGGAISNHGALTLNRVTLQNSSARGQAGTPALGGGIYSDGAITVTDSTIKNNQAIGGDGQNTGSWGGSAAGGGVFISGGTASITNTALASNLARGGNGADGGKGGETGYLPGGNGGAGFGGGIYVAAGAVELRQNTITQNTAQGGIAGNTRKGYSSISAPPGQNGPGQGGGIYITPGRAASLDSFTQSHTTANTASTSDNDIFGSFNLLA